MKTKGGRMKKSIQEVEVLLSAFRLRPFIESPAARTTF
jgi:hypothetical protein